MKKTLICAVVAMVFAVSGLASGTVIVIDPDAFPDGADISNVFPGVTLSATGSTPATSTVFSITNSISSTGTQVFGHDGEYDNYWGLVSGTSFEASFRSDFDSLVKFVSLDFIPNDSYDPGILQAFNSAGVLLDRVDTPGNSGSGSVETATISRAMPDISYVLASTPRGVSIFLDHMVFEVPEPATICLLGLGGLLLRRRKSA